MIRVIAVVPLLAIGCNARHVAAIAGETEGASDGGSGPGEVADKTSDVGRSTAGTSTSDSVATEDTSVTPCTPPSPLDDCDASADALRAPEILCYDNVAAVHFESLDPDAWRRARELGNANWVSTESSAILVLSTGVLPSAGSVGEINLEPGAGELSPTDNENPNSVALPAGVDAESLGAAFGGQADDLLWFTFDATVPSGVHGYAIRVGFLSAAYPEELDTDISDLFVWWHESKAYVGNLATWQGRPATVAGLGDRMHEFAGDHPMLLRTGIDGTTGERCELEGENVDCPIGATTGWMNLRGPADPGETIHVIAALVDQGSLDRDTLVTLDGFAWICDGCTPGETCGLQ